MKKTKIKIYAIILVVMSLLLVFAGIPFDSYKTTRADGEIPTLSLKGSDIIYVGFNSYKFKVATDDNKPVIEDTTVRVRTKNGSAVAGVNYNGFDKDVTISKGQKSVEVAVAILASPKFRTDNNFPQFSIEMYDVTTDNAKINEQNSVKNVYFDCTYQYSLTSGGIMNDYEKVDNHIGASNTDNKYTDTGLTTVWFNVSEQYNVNKYVNTGLANYYVAARAWLDEPWYEDTDSNPLYIYLYDNETGAKLYSCAFWDLDENYVTFATEYGEVDHKDEYYTSDSCTIYTYIHWGSSFNVRFFRLGDNSKSLMMQWKQNSKVNRKINQLLAFATIRDTKVPQITGYYIDKNIVTDGQPLRISVTLSEPVTITSGKEPSITATLSGTGAYRNKSVKFNYAGGNGTSTLYFDYYPDAGYGTINNVSVTGFSSMTYVNDCGKNTSGVRNSFPDLSTENSLRTNKCRPIDFSSDLSCNFDNTNPVIDFESLTINQYSKKHSVDVVVSGSSISSIRYTWSQDSHLEKDEIKHRLYDKTFTLSKDDVTGTYYLHLVAQSYYSDETYTVVAVGPFYFDNTAPEITFDADTIGGDLHERSIKFGIADNVDIQGIIMFCTENPPYMPGSSIDKYLIYGTLESEAYGDYTAYDDGVLTLTMENGNVIFTLDPVVHLGLDEEKGYADYYIGFAAIDSLGNISDVNYIGGVVSFDVRNSFTTAMTINGGPADEQAVFVADGAYVIDISSGTQTITYTRDGNSDQFDIYSVFKYEGNVKTDIKIEFGMYFANYSADHGAGFDKVTFDAKEPGYYEISFMAVNEGETTYSTVNKLYITNGNTNAHTSNYSTIYEGKGQILKNEVYMLGNGRYYYRTSSGMGALATEYYNNSDEPLVFSSRQKAVEYVQIMEYLDLYAVQLTLNDVNLLKNDNYRIALGEDTVPAVGQVWLRYKSTTWNYSSTPRDWAYYYYGTSMDIDINALSPLLQRSINDVTDTIVKKGGLHWFTTEDGLNENGVPEVDAMRIPATKTYTETKNGSNISVTYTHDFEIYSDTILNSAGINIGTWYNFSYKNATKVFYAELNSEKDYTNINAYTDDFERLTGLALNQFAGNGSYVIRELDDNGMRDYILFVDKVAPTITVQYIDIEGQQVPFEEIGIDKDGEIYYTTEFSFRQFIDNIDVYSHIDIFDIEIEKTFFKSINLIGFSTDSVYDNGYSLPRGVYLIEVYDRSGNHFSINVSVATSELSLNMISIKDDRLIISLVDRIPEDIIYFSASYNGTEIMTDFSASCDRLSAGYSITYFEAGIYEFILADSYGYTIKVLQTLERANPYDNVTWLVRTEDRYDFLETKAITNFSTNVYYVKSDEKLSFRVEAPELYSYEFSGMLEYDCHEDGGVMIYDITSSEKWSVKVYYTRFPETYVVFNRIGDNVLAPAPVSLRTDSGYTDQYGIAQPDALDKIVLYVYTDAELSGDLLVTVKTRDMSAISQLGDYEPYNNSVTLTNDKKEAKIVISTTPSAYAVYDKKTDRYFTRTFEAFISDIQGNGEIGDNGKMECAIRGSSELTAVTKSDTKYFAEYMQGYKDSINGISLNGKSSTLDESKAGEIYSESRNYSVDASWYSSFIETGLASIYTTVGFSLSGDDPEDSSILDVKLSDTKNNASLFTVGLNNLEDNDENSVLLGTTYSKAKVRRSETYNKNNSIKLNSARGNAPSGRYYKLDETSLGRLKLEVSEGSYRYYVPGSEYSPGYYVYDWPKRYLTNMYGYSVVIDSTAPVITGWYLNHDVIKIHDNLRLSVRFSEPVYIKGSLPYVSARVNGTATYINFEYAGGAGTDTLYFEFIPEMYEKEINVSGITIQSIWHQQSICDYAVNIDEQNNTLGSITPPTASEYDFSCTLDSRTPEIDTNYVLGEGIIKSASVDISVTRVSPGGLLQTAWTKEPETPANYTNKQDILASGQTFYIQSDDVSGVYYLHVKVSSEYGKVASKTIGPFKFDSLPPVIKNLEVEEASKPLYERQISFEVNDQPLGLAASGIDKLYMAYSTYGQENEISYKLLYDYSNDTNRVNIDVNGRVSFLLNYKELGLEEESQRNYILGFYASDKLGNVIPYTSIVFYNSVVNFDSRSTIDVEVSTDEEYEIFNAGGTSVLDSTNGVKLIFKFLRYADVFDIHQFYIAGKLVDQSDYERYFTYTTDANGVVIDVVPNVTGYLSFVLKAESGEGENIATQYTNKFNFYFTVSVDNAETNNFNAIKDGTLLVNKIYYLGDTKYYYYEGTTVRTINYNNSNLLQAFSSSTKAYEYVYYNELLDLYAFEIPSNAIATSLNNGDGSYRKAEADSTKVAEVGQVWIRYKKSTWDESTSTDSWVYYYYGNSTELIRSSLPASIQTALAQVTNTIVAKGKYSYLTSYEGLDKNYAPYLNEKQIHFVDEYTTETLNGSRYKTAIRFDGDYAIYDSKISLDAYPEQEFSIITTYNFDFGEFTRLYYAKDYGRIALNSDYAELPKDFTFANINTESGVYWIREIDENGMRDYRVYIDKTAPEINITYANGRGVVNSIVADSSVDGLVLNGETLDLINIGTNEVDTMAYVAVFKKNGILYNVYRSEDFVAGKISIPEGQYYLEVCDRSGNMYRIVVRLNSTKMVCKVTGEENKFMRVTCNRDSSDISVYEIYLDNELVESNYASNMTFYASGLYTIRIEDWYGNVFNYEYELKRTLPLIDWSYEEADTYVPYDGTQDCLKFSKTSEKEYLITTNKKLLFTYTTANDYTVEFSDRNLSYTKQEFNGRTRIRINDEINWTVKISYTKYPDIYVIYKCELDIIAPTISVDARQELFVLYDESQMAEQNATVTENSADLFTPDTIRYEIYKVLSRSVNNNATIFANMFTVRFADNSLCNHVKVYLDGELLNDYFNNSGVADITLSRFGTYKIVATDVLGNESVFNFRNQKPTSFTYIVDDNVVEPKASPLSYMYDIDGTELVYPVDKYGNTYTLIGYEKNNDTAFLITNGDEKNYVRFDISGGVVSRVIYKLVRTENSETGEVVLRYQKILNPILDSSDIELSDKVEENRFRIANSEEVGVNIYAQIDSNRNVLFYIDSPKNSKVTIEARCIFDENSQPYYAKFVLSGKTPGISLVATTHSETDKRIDSDDSTQVIYLSGVFHVYRRDYYNDEDVNLIKIAYSKTNDFTDYITIYDVTHFNPVEFDAEGFYSIISENVFGARSEFVAILSNTLNAVLKSTLDDDKVYQYSSDYDETIYTNKSIEILVYTSKIDAEVTYNGNIVTDSITAIDGYCSLRYEEKGTYSIRITDTFGNVIIYRFEIGNEEIDFNDDYLYGYNEKALRIDDYYTNKKLSLNAEALMTGGVKFVSVTYRNNSVVLFDLIAESKVEISDEILLDAIGNDGDGIYTVMIRNCYGDISVREIHYRETPTLKLTRLIRTSTIPEVIEFTDGTNVIYSNYSVTFETTSSVFDVRVNEARVDLPLTLAFPSDKDDIGEYFQTVTYVDEYGFEYTFEVNLVRKKLDIDYTKTINVVRIDDIVMTKDKIVLDIDESVICTYSLNAGEIMEYTSGTVLSQDGTYRFYLTDVAGNISTTTIKKDTIAEYMFTYAGSDLRVENGSVINSGRVMFSPMNKDSVVLKTILLNGNPYEDVSVTGFSEMGKWEFVLEDKIGNTAYFMFYIINHSMSKFDYTTPYTFKITEITLDNGDGLPVSYMNNVLQFDSYSQMSFVESGTYTVKALSSATSAVLSFTVVIDRNPPQIELEGVTNGGKTVKNVKITGYQIGDTIQIFKDGEEISTVHILTTSTSVPEIKTKGNYKVVVTNDAGNSVEFEFYRQYTANTATTVFMISVLIMMSIGIFIGLVSRKRLKV